VPSSEQTSLLKGELPSWATIKSHERHLLIEAAVPRPNGGCWPVVTIEISIAKDGKLQAREFPARRWPTFCPQRHINKGGHFCLGLAEVPIVNDTDSAQRWWEILSLHLQTQFVADATKLWPRELEWDHGEAGEVQAIMERMAEQHGLLNDVRSAHFYGEGWLAGELPRLTKKEDRLVNGRSPCPRGCKKRKHPILRRACPKREAVFQLVRMEREKRRQSKLFWEAAKKEKCCGKMKNCPLKGSI
jgi:hypothetical protein